MRVTWSVGVRATSSEKALKLGLEPRRSYAILERFSERLGVELAELDSLAERELHS